MRVDAERESFLLNCLSVEADLSQRLFPFKGVRLERRDIEWLIAFQQGTVSQTEVPGSPRQASGFVDLRGADLRDVDLSRLNLKGMLGGLSDRERFAASQDIEEAASVDLRGATLFLTDLDGAQLAGARLDEAYMASARLQGACLASANLTRADLRSAHLEDVMIEGAILDGADLTRIHLERADIRGASFRNADLKFALLMEADLREVHFESADLTRTHLEGADLRLSFFDIATTLDRVYFCDKVHGCARLADVHWGDANMALIDWTSIKTLTGKKGEVVHRQSAVTYTAADRRKTTLHDYEEAVRTNRQLAVQLQGQGLNEDAARFSQAAYAVRRRIYLVKRRFLRYLLSALIALLAGYGYAPLRTIAWYIGVISLCALVYAKLGSPDPIVESITAFHGRGFFEEVYAPDSLQYRIAAAEAVIGLVIEVSFIATFTQRFFGREAGN
jgi:uncharacterized protein YjbI with pentapeptide repeats